MAIRSSAAPLPGQAVNRDASALLSRGGGMVAECRDSANWLWSCNAACAHTISTLAPLSRGSSHSDFSDAPSTCSASAASPRDVSPLRDASVAMALGPRGAGPRSAFNMGSEKDEDDEEEQGIFKFAEDLGHEEWADEGLDAVGADVDAPQLHGLALADLFMRS